MARHSGVAGGGSSFAATNHKLLRRTGALAETMSRLMDGTGAGGTSIAALVSGTVLCTAIALQGGIAINKLTWKAGSTAANLPTHQFACIMDSGLVVKALSADLLTTAWAGQAEQQFTLTAPFTPSVDALYFVGLVVVATNVPTLDGALAGQSAGNNSQDLVPFLAFLGDTGQTVPGSLPGTVAKSAFSRAIPYVWAS